MVGYNYPVFLFERGLALVNLVAFASFYAQIALVTSKGLTPVSETMQKYTRKMGDKAILSTKLYEVPCVFWFSTSDTFIKAVPIVGMCLSVLAMLGFYPYLCLPLCMLLYNSCRLIGQPWLGLQMHATLVETDFLYTITAPFKYVHPFAMVFAARFLTWRIMLGCGVCKYSTGDKSWRDLTAMSKHYYTQPLPNPLSWRAHHMPMWFHKFSSVMTHVIEGPFTFLCFGNEAMRCIAFVGFFGLSAMINVTGNYGFLGLLTTVQSFSLLDDSLFFKLSEYIPFADFLSPAPQVLAASPLLRFALSCLSWAVVLPYLVLSLVPLVSTFYGTMPWKSEFLKYFSSSRFGIVRSGTNKVDQLWDAGYRKLHRSPLLQRTFFKYWPVLEDAYYKISQFSIINRYAKFGSMSTYRWELVFEASDDGENWQEYEFKYKPDNPYKRPAVIPLHLPGLDWRIWFLGPQLKRGGLASMPSWFFKLMDALCEGRKDILKLLAGGAALRDTPPKYVRCVAYDYHFSPKEKGTAEEQSEDAAPSQQPLDEQGNVIPAATETEKGGRGTRVSAGKMHTKEPWWTREFVGQICVRTHKSKDE